MSASPSVAHQPPTRFVDGHLRAERVARLPAPVALALFAAGTAAGLIAAAALRLALGA